MFFHGVKSDGIMMTNKLHKKNGVFQDVTPCGSCKSRCSEELDASLIRVTRIGELGTTLAVASNGISSQRVSVASYS
jgi:hypothetical protein